MKIINLDSKFEISNAQISFAESVIISGEDEHVKYDSISILMNEIPIFLLSPDSMPKEEKGHSKKPSSEWLGFYQHSYRIMGIDTPIIGLCPERIIGCVSNDDELIILIAKVLIHEFAHAKMRLHPSSNYDPIDEFYIWMEEPMANLITLKYFEYFNRGYRTRREQKQQAYATTLISPFDYVKKFISQQPDNYRLGLDLFEHRVFKWWIWRNQKGKIQTKTKEKQDWLNYVKPNVGQTNKRMLQDLFDQLHN